MAWARAHEAAAEVGVATDTVRVWGRRGLVRRRRVDLGWEYEVGDVQRRADRPGSGPRARACPLCGHRA